MSKVSKEFLSKEQFDNILTLTVIVGVLGFLIAAYFDRQTSSEQKSQILTAIIGFGAAIVAFRWGSSRSANRKDETIDQLLNTTPNSTTTIQTTQSSAPDNKIGPIQ